MKLKIVFILLLCQQFIIAQLTDDFSDNDFSNNPTWSGEVEKFEVLDEQLHLNDTTEVSPAILFTAAPTQGLATWEFSVLLDFNPSADNFAKVYLNASSSNLDGDLNGYFVRFGEGGALDDFSLYKQKGSNSTKIIDGEDGLAAEEPVSAKVRVTRDEVGNWELFVDKDVSGNFQSQGTAFDDEFLSGSFLGVWCKYTESRSDDFYFDDFLVDPIFEDTDAPELLSIVVLGPNELQLNFSEELDINTAQNTDNYTVEGIGNPELAILNQESPSEVLLTFENSFQLNVEQTMNIANLQDLGGNILENASGTFIFAVAEYRSVVINEIMADPSSVTGLPASEFVELYNRTSGNLDLSGRAFSDATAIKSIPDGTIIEANSYLILCSDNTLWTDYENVIDIDLPALNNGGDDLSLFDGLDNLIDNVNYSDSWYGDIAKGIYTLELLDADYPCQGAASWAASRDPNGGTPGAKNSQDGVPFDDVGPSLISAFVVGGDSLVLTFSESLDEASLTNGATLSIEPNINIGAIIYDQDEVTVLLEEALEEGIIYTVTVEGVSDCAGNVIGMLNQGQFLIGGSLALKGDVIINEIMAKGNPAVNLPESEFVELFNRTDRNFDLSGWSFSDASSEVNFGTTIPDGTILEANSYLILCPNSNINLWAAYSNKVGFSLPSLNDDSDELSLFNDLGNLIDDVDYSNSWYGDENKDGGGYSLELLDPDYQCKGASSWAASIDPNGGTPGAKNSQEGVPFDDVRPDLTSAYYVAGTNSLVLAFSESLDEASLTNGTFSIEPNLNIGITIYDNDVLTVLLEEAVQEGIIYTVTVEGVADCEGNVIGMFNQVKFGLGSLASEGDVIVNEILSSGSDYVELYNKSDKFVDLSNYSIAHANADKLDSLVDIKKISEGYLLFPDSYVVLSKDVKSIMSAYGGCANLNPQNFIQVASFEIRSDEDVVAIFETGDQEKVLDQVKYDDSWHNRLLSATNGIALERIDPDGPSNDVSNWTSASINNCKGSPSYRNSQFSAGTSLGEDEISIDPKIFSPDIGGNANFTQINYQFDKPDNVMSVTIYDDNGRLIRRIAEGEVVGSSGTYKWNGADDAGEKALMGIYIVFIEVFDLDGNTKTFKETLVVAGNVD